MNPTPVLGWDAPRTDWLTARRRGLGASDISAALGFSRWESPWEVWAEKTGVLLLDRPPTAAMQLGTDLEPWLLSMAPRLLGQEVAKTPHMLYADPDAPWQLCSPDGFAADGGLVEGKTARILSGRLNIEEWLDDQIPLDYEFQGRWQLHVMNRERVYIVALVAGLGLIFRVIDRDSVIESQMVEQVTRWREKHIVGGVEPPVGRMDLEALTAAYRDPVANAEIVLDDDVLGTLREYVRWRTVESDAKKQKEECAAIVKATLGNNTVGKYGDQTAVTWNPKRGEVDWERMARELAAKHDVELPDPEQYRKPGSRTLSVKTEALD